MFTKIAAVFPAGATPLFRQRLCFLLGLAVAAPFVSSVVAWKFHHDSALGAPLLGPIYPPLAVIGWARSWGLTPGYRTDFLGGLTLALVPAALPFLGLRLYELYGPLRVGDRDEDLGLGTPADLKRGGRVRAAGDGVVIGAAGRAVLRDDGDAHVLIMGATRSGKGAGHVVPTLLAHRRSVLVFDPKGDLAAVAGACRARLGPTFVFDPTDTAASAYNPLLELRGGATLIGDCQTAAHMLAGSGGAHDDSFWDSATAHLLTAMLVHVCGGDDPTLAHLWRLALAIEADRCPETRHPHARAVFAGHAAHEPRIRSSLNATLITRLGFLADPVLLQATSRSDFRPSDLQADDDPVSVFLSVPIAHATRLRPLTGLVLQTLLNPLTASRTHTPDGRRKRRDVLALLDEFPQLGPLDFIETKLAVCADYGVRAALVCQDIDQIRKIYGARQSITANCRTLCVIPGFSEESLEIVRRWGGEHAVAFASKQRKAGGLGPPNVGQNETRVPVLNVRDMLRRADKEVLVFTPGAPPTWLRKVRYFEHPQFLPLLPKERVPT